MKVATSLVTLAVVVAPALAVVPIYGQCGGQNWTGETGARRLMVSVSRSLTYISQYVLLVPYVRLETHSTPNACLGRPQRLHRVPPPRGQRPHRAQLQLRPRRPQPALLRLQEHVSL